MGVKRVEDCNISMKVIVRKDMLNVISAYATQVRVELHLKDKFWADMEFIQGIPPTKKFLIGGDLNRHVGKETGAHARVHGGFRFLKLKNEGQSIIDFF